MVAKGHSKGHSCMFLTEHASGQCAIKYDNYNTEMMIFFNLGFPKKYIQKCTSLSIFCVDFDALFVTFYHAVRRFGLKMNNPGYQFVTKHLFEYKNDILLIEMCYDFMFSGNVCRTVLQMISLKMIAGFLQVMQSTRLCRTAQQILNMQLGQRNCSLMQLFALV